MPLLWCCRRWHHCPDAIKSRARRSSLHIGSTTPYQHHLGTGHTGDVFRCQGLPDPVGAGIPGSARVDAIGTGGHGRTCKITTMLGTRPASCTPDSSPFSTLRGETCNVHFSVGFSTSAPVAGIIWNCNSGQLIERCCLPNPRSGPTFSILRALLLLLLQMFPAFHGSYHRSTH